ncbi:MAG: cytochrome c-type biogenesis protein, partial [Pseudomonadota bacterium]|nr:cytochrome c-type biogenesis protein [Pseudomonadota bacterium]
MSTPLGLIVFLLGLASVAHGASTVDVLAFESEQQQRRYKALIDEFRCPKCLNTNLSGSDAPIAQDLRRSVYRLVQEGRSDQQIRDFLQQRYGDFVLYKPP